MEKATKDKFQYWLAAFIVGGFFGVLLGLLTTSVPAENKDALNIALGSLVGGFSAVLGYFFGSSKGSSEKNDIIAGQSASAVPSAGKVDA